MMAKPSLTVTLGSVGDFPIIRAAGELDLDTVPDLRHAVASLVAAQPESPLIFDLQKVTFMDGSGLSILIAAQKRLDRGPGEVVVITEQPMVLLVLSLSGADGSLHVYPNEEAFLASLDGRKSRGAGPHPRDRPPPLSLL